MNASRKLFPFVWVGAAVLAALLLLASGRSAGLRFQAPSLASLSINDEDVADLPAFEEVIEAVLPGVVQVQAVQRAPFELGAEQLEDFFTPPRQGLFAPPAEDVTGLGAGIVVREDGYIVTSRHLLRGASTIRVLLHDGTRQEAEVVGSNALLDVAVLRIPARGLQPLLLGEDKDAQIGQWVIAVGSPLSPDFNQSVTAGIITQVLPLPLAMGGGTAMLKTDAALNLGNSGGPLVNLEGLVVGMASVPMRHGRVYSGVGYALPAEHVRLAAEAIIEAGSMVPGQLGIEVAPVVAARPAEEGPAQVIHIEPGSAAEHAGMLQGDVVMTFDGEPLKDYLDFSERVAGKQIGETILLTVQRAGRTMDISILLDDLLNIQAGLETPADETPEQRLIREMGFSVADAKDEDLAGLSYGVQDGVVVVFVDASSDAYQDGDLRGGMVITEVADRRIRNEKDFYKVYERIPEGVYFLVMVHPPEGGVILTALEKPETE